jgi:ankyrin repeat protein
LGGNTAITDKDGWTAMHWAAFHGSTEAAKELVKLDESSKLLSVKDRDGKTPLELAMSEKNDSVVAVFETALGETKKDK